MKKLLTLIISASLLASCGGKPAATSDNTADTITAHTDTATASTDPVRAKPAGPDTSVKITEDYARLVARDAYFWAWPMVNMYNRRLAFSQIKQLAYAGPLPQSPLNQFCMLTDYVDPISAEWHAQTRM